MPLRLFAALPVPVAFHPELLRLQKGLPGAKWRPAENFHITLRFAGDLGEHQAEDFDGELRNVHVPPFALHLQGTNWFGKSDPRTLWIGLGPSAELMELQAQCERAARRAGLAPETHPFRPHMTLAYLNGCRLDRLTAWCRDRAAFKTEAFTATHFSLYQSFSRKKGPNLYEALADYPLY